MVLREAEQQPDPRRGDTLEQAEEAVVASCVHPRLEDQEPQQLPEAQAQAQPQAQVPQKVEKPRQTQVVQPQGQVVSEAASHPNPALAPSVARETG